MLNKYNENLRPLKEINRYKKIISYNEWLLYKYNMWSWEINK